MDVRRVRRSPRSQRSTERKPSAFDTAAALLPIDTVDPDGLYVALDSVHLARWHGNALARFGDPEAVGLLTSALNRLDPTFTRAETGLHVDLATALVARNEL